jgi:hypothetical protein
MTKYPATCVVHWATGPVNCCEKHANMILGLGRFLGTHVVATVLTTEEQCSNCVSESELEDKKGKV